MRYYPSNSTALSLLNERSFARDLATFNSAGKGASLRDHDEDFARQAVKVRTSVPIVPAAQSLPTKPNSFKMFNWSARLTEFIASATTGALICQSVHARSALAHPRRTARKIFIMVKLEDAEDERHGVSRNCFFVIFTANPEALDNVARDALPDWDRLKA